MPVSQHSGFRERAGEEGFVQLILKVWSSNPHYSGGCDYAVVDSNAALLKLALRRIGVLCNQKLLDSSLSETYYWDSSAQYFSPWINRASKYGPGLEACFKLEESIDRLQIDTREVVVASGDFTVPENQIGAVESAQMIVRDGGIAFNALLKHSDTYVTTAEISKEMIESALASAAN
jgi:hypothetical protein